jgi:hypothetical protein
MTPVEMIARLVEMHNELEVMRIAAEEARKPTAITIGLQWLRDDMLKVIADLDPSFPLPGDL